MTRVNIVADVLGVILTVSIAYLLTKIGAANPAAEIDATELMRTGLFIGFIAAAAGFAKQAVADFAKFLREDTYGS